MDFLQLTRNWTNGEISQAKSMILLGCLTAVISFFLIISPQVLHHGIAIPIVIITLLFLFYGSFVFRNRPQKLAATIKSFQQNAKQTVETERKRILKEKENYYKIRVTWALVAILGLISYLLLQNEFYQGIAIGTMLLGIATFIVDTLLLKRINKYYVGIESLFPMNGKTSSKSI